MRLPADEEISFLKLFTVGGGGEAVISLQR